MSYQMQMMQNLIALKQNYLHNQLQTKVANQKDQDNTASLQKIYQHMNSTNGNNSTHSILAVTNLAKLKEHANANPIQRQQEYSATGMTGNAQYQPHAPAAESARINPQQLEVLKINQKFEDDLSANRANYKENTGAILQNCGQEQSEPSECSGTDSKKPASAKGKMGRWTASEKERFIEALKIYGKDWKKVEKFIGSRSGAQIRSHAQKFFINVERTKGMDIDQYIKQAQREFLSLQDKREDKAISKCHTPKEMFEEDKLPETGMITPAGPKPHDNKSQFISERRRRLSTNFDDNSFDITVAMPGQAKIIPKPTLSANHSVEANDIQEAPLKEIDTKTRQELGSFIEKMKSQMILNAQKQVKIPTTIKQVKPATQMIMDNSKMIKILEEKRTKLHLDFFNSLNGNMLIISQKETERFIYEFSDVFSELQGEFLKLLNKELDFYSNELSVTGISNKQNAKDLVNASILKNMIEILNMQILLKLTSKMLCKNENRPSEKLSSFSPIDTQLFKQLLPDSFNSSYLKSSEPLQITKEIKSDKLKEISQKISRNQPPQQIQQEMLIKRLGSAVISFQDQQLEKIQKL